MRIADAHTHIYPAKIAEKATRTVGEFYESDMRGGCGTEGGLLDSGRKIGVEKFLVCSVATKGAQAKSITKFIADECAAHSEFVGLGAFHQDAENPLEIFDLVQETGLKGFKIHSDFQHIAVDDEKLFPFYKECAQRGLIVLLHIGDKRYDWSGPERLARVMDKVPDLKAHAAHFGGYTQWEIAVRCLKDSGCVFDTSSSLNFLEPQVARDMCRELGIENMMFGTDFPMWDHEAEFMRFKKMGLEPFEEKAILFDNFARAYGIQ